VGSVPAACRACTHLGRVPSRAATGGPTR
jgi:hypothetical protein